MKGTKRGYSCPRAACDEHLSDLTGSSPMGQILLIRRGIELGARNDYE